MTSTIDGTIDSVVLDLEYDSLGFYGDPNAVHNIEVFDSRLKTF